MYKILVFGILLITSPCWAKNKEAAAKTLTASSSRNNIDTFAIIKRFIYATYPELKDEYELLLGVDDLYYKLPPTAPQEIGFTIDSFCKAPVPANAPSYHVRPHAPCRTHYPDRDFLMRGRFVFTSSGQLQEYDGVIIEADKKLQKIIDGINFSVDDNSHPVPNEIKPREAEIARRLVAAGAQYMPDKQDGFVQHLREQHLDRFFGKSRMKSAKFIYWTADHGNPILQWLVQLELSQRHKAYLLLYNPVDGSLSSVLPVGDLSQFDLRSADSEAH
jgi:hypothetical protein